MMCLGVNLFGFTLLVYWASWICRFNVFHWIWKSLKWLFVWYFFLFQILSLLSFCYSLYMYDGKHNGVPHFSESLFMFLHSFFSQILGCVIFIGLSSSLLYLASASSALPWIPSSESLISVTLLFNSWIYIWSFLIISIFWYSVFD